jgi:6-pyruvoyltetrahydropterin/6-carboxytetrahydropterin synthase
MDFTLLDPIDTWIKTQFDHTVAIAQDDPKLAIFQAMNDQGLCDLRVLPGTGCAKFAEHVFQHVKQWMTDQGLLTRVTIRSVECSEHEGNTFMYIE